MKSAPIEKSAPQRVRFVRVWRRMVLEELLFVILLCQVFIYVCSFIDNVVGSLHRYERAASNRH